MTYNKPEINALGNAVTLIQDFTKQPPRTLEFSDPRVRNQLQPAYDLDE